jgi:ketosteroid isomerase-like protein
MTLLGGLRSVAMKDSLAERAEFRTEFPVSGEPAGKGRGTPSFLRVKWRHCKGWFVLRAIVVSLVLSGFLGWPLRAGAQEIPLEKCDALPVIAVTVAGQPTIFLVDTAATSMLNLKSFTQGRARDIRVTSWRGTLATSAKEVTLGEMVVGNTKLVGLQLPAIDLSAIGDACGRRIDGVLGVDLIAKLGITIDLKKQMLHVRTVDEERAAELAAEMHMGMGRCLEAFNASDERAFGECLDPKIVLFTVNTEFYGREQVMGYFRDKYFHQQPAAKLEIRENAFHAVGEAVWYEYEFTIESALGLLRGKGMAMCRKSEGRWRMASMHHSVETLEPAVAAR